MHTQFAREVAAAGLLTAPSPSPPVSEEDIAPLPEAARRYLRFMRAVGRPRDWSFRLHVAARFKPALEAEWKPAEIWQFNSSRPVARIHHMKLHYYGVPVMGRDTYLRGTGHLVIRPLDLVTVENDHGPALDTAELLTWLNDAVLFAPSMLLSPAVTWCARGSDAFELEATDEGRTVSARVAVDARGAPLEFSTQMPAMRDAEAHRLRRARWSIPIPGWQEVGGRRLPTAGRAVWRLPAGDYAYVEVTIRPGDVEYNVSSHPDDLDAS